MRILFDGELHVHYGFINLTTNADELDFDHAIGGQVNGLCGAASPGALRLITGLHTGNVPITVEWHDQEPLLAVDWEDVVEAPINVENADAVLAAFDSFEPLRLPAVGPHRARYCARGLDAAHAQDTRMDGEPAPDRYLLQLWPALPAPDQIVRQSSALAAYWHGEARETSPPPPPPTPEELAEAARREEAERLAAEAASAERLDLLSWGGSRPSERLRSIGGPAMQIARLDRELAELIAALDPAGQRAIARWTARDACRRAGDATLDWAPALRALDRGEPLPAPFDDRKRVWQALFPGPRRMVVTRVVSGATPRAHRPLAPAASALSAVLGAAGDDPARAAMSALNDAAVAHADPAGYLAQVRADVPDIVRRG